MAMSKRDAYSILDRAETLKRSDILPLMLDRPKTRGDCEDGPRPCPFVSCRYHLMRETIDRFVDDNLALIAIQAADMTCALDVADDGPKTQEQTARLLGVTQQRVDYIEHRAIEKARRSGSRI